MSNIEKVAEQAVKKKRGSNYPSNVDSHLSARPEEISSVVNHALGLFRCKPCTSDDEVEERIEKYFDDCYTAQRLPTVEGMALALGTVRQTLFDWEKNKTKGHNRSDIIKRAKAAIAEIDAQLVASGKIPQIVYIFRAKNYYGMQDKTEVSLETANPMGESQDQKQLEEKYNSVIEAEGTEIS